MRDPDGWRNRLNLATHRRGDGDGIALGSNQERQAADVALAERIQVDGG